MNRILPQIASLGASLIAISPQTIQQSFFMADQHKLRWPLLSDFGNQVAKQFGIVYRVPEDQQNIYRRSFVNLPFINGDESWELPIPSTFIIDHDGTIRFASVNPDYTQRPEPEQLVEELNRAMVPSKT
jgi:peroxiredoxin